MKNEKITIEYLAGIIDGEGCIGTTRTGKGKNRVGRIVVANTFAKLLFLLKENFGGTVSIRDKGAQENWKPYGSIAWSNRQAEKILQAVLPYLIVKKEHAQVCLELIQMRNASKSDRYNYVKTPYGSFTNRVVAYLKPEIREREEQLALSLSKLNKKGT